MKKININNLDNFSNKFLYFHQSLDDYRKGKDVSCKINNPNLLILNINSFNKTPSSLLCDGFWNSIDYRYLKLQLNSNFNFLI